jgi:XTP/dITP diphosphohydrolase
MIRICFATNNKNKLYEVKDAVPTGIEILSLESINCYEELPETSPTLEGNSLQKATFVLDHHNIPCFADDTGLEVDALNGEPGVYSARYAGIQKSSEDNIRLLLSKLQGIRNRKARFRTVITLVGLNDHPVLFEGVVKGTITESKKGEGGFGYDPVFQPEGFAKTFAEMDLNEKNQISHRAIAVQKLSRYLLNKLE